MGLEETDNEGRRHPPDGRAERELSPAVDGHRLPGGSGDGRPVDREPSRAPPAVRRLDAARGDDAVEQRDRAERDRPRLAGRAARRSRSRRSETERISRRSQVGRGRPERDHPLRRQYEGGRAGPDARRRAARRSESSANDGAVVVVVVAWSSCPWSSCVPSARADATRESRAHKGQKYEPDNTPHHGSVTESPAGGTPERVGHSNPFDDSVFRGWSPTARCRGSR